jgi:hypothetical protein
MSAHPSGIRHESALDELYSSNLLYVPDCWKLCGDAHCCGFSRYKKRFKILTSQPFQSLPMLPGEYDYLQARGWTSQFGEHERRVTEYAIDERVIRAEELVSWRSGCCCTHETRTVVCRLYPLLPVLDFDGNVTGIDDRFGSFEELEHIDAMPSACKVDALPFSQTDIFLRMSRLIGSVPEWNFHLRAYQITRRHVFSRVRDSKAKSTKTAFELFELMYFMRRLFDHDALKAELRALADGFEARYGDRFSLPRATQSAN